MSAFGNNPVTSRSKEDSQASSQSRDAASLNPSSPRTAQARGHPEEKGVPLTFKGGITIVEHREARSPRVPIAMGKGKGKAVMVPDLVSPVVDTPSPPSLEALMSDSILLEQPLKDLEEEVVTTLGSV